MDPARLRRSFAAQFDHDPEVLVRSPGRVNLIGDHTDYNDGWALPAALDIGTDLAACRRRDRILDVVSEALGARDRVSIDTLDPQAGPMWTRYVRGYASMLRHEGVDVPGAEILIGGDLPLGAGLSSSASVGLGLATTLLALAGTTMHPTELAMLGRRVENEIVGLSSGLMDQLAVTHGRVGHALLVDCSTNAVEPVPLPPVLRLLVLDSAVPRRLAETGYNQRRAECDASVRALRRVEPGVRSLRDVTPELLAAADEVLLPVERRRARHVVTENRRVLEAAGALRRGDPVSLGALMVESHRSLRDDFEVSTPEVDELVGLALECEGVFGARLTGAGFGGSVIAVVAELDAERAAFLVTDAYRSATGRPGTARLCSAADGVGVVNR